MAARDYDAHHARLVQQNNQRTPRARRWADTLFDLAHQHGNQALEDLAIAVDAHFCQAGREMTPEDETRLMAAATDTLKKGGQ